MTSHFDSSPFNVFKRGFTVIPFKLPSEIDFTCFMTEEEAYIMAYTMAQGTWGRKPNTNKVMGYYDYIITHTGYFAICGAKGCIRACMNMLEKSDRIENKFHNKFYYKKSWTLPNKPEKVSNGVNPYREEYLDENYPGIRENEYKKTED